MWPTCLREPSHRWRAELVRRGWLTAAASSTLSSHCEFDQAWLLLQSLAGSACTAPATISPAPQKPYPILAPLPPLGAGFFLLGGDFVQEVVSSSISYGPAEEFTSTITYDIP